MSSERLPGMSSKRPQDMSSRRLEDVFSVTIFHLPRRLQDIFKTSWKTKTVMLKTCWRRLQDMFWRYLEDEMCLAMRFFAYLFSVLGRYSAVTVTFFLNTSSQICLYRQTMCRFLCLQFSQSKSGPIYCLSEHAMTLSLVQSKKFPGLVLTQEVPVHLYASSLAESMFLQFSFLPWQLPNL